MEEQIQEAPISPIQPVRANPVLPKKKYSLKIIAISLIVISLIAIGVYAGMQLGKRQVTPDLLLQSKTPTIVPKPTEIIPTPDETVYTEQSQIANWKTYRNEKYEFEFRYPSVWGLSVRSDEGYAPISISSTNNDCAFYVDYNNAMKVTNPIKLWFEKEGKKSCSGGGCTAVGNIIFIEDAKIDDKIAYKYIHGAGMTEYEGYLISYNNTIYSIEYEFNGSPEEDTCKNYYNQILSTFKFD